MNKDLYFRCVQLAYDNDGQLIYKGENLSTNATDGDANWWITKFTWADSKLTKIQYYTSTWTARASYPTT